MRAFTPRRSHVRSPSDPFTLLQRRTDILDHAASAIAFVLLIASWAVVYVTVVPADPMQAHRTHLVEVLRP